jgi:two-component system copper resistance phosphate regulon response regulator CusR
VEWFRGSELFLHWEEDTMQASKGKSKKQTGKKKSTYGFKGARILVIDDEPLILRLIKKALEMEGCLVDIAMTGAEGVKLAWETQYQIVLVDLEVPDMKGEEILEEINKIPLSARPVKIILTGKINLKDHSAYQKFNVFDILYKPFHLPQLYACVKSALKAGKGKPPEKSRKED